MGSVHTKCFFPRRWFIWWGGERINWSLNLRSSKSWLLPIENADKVGKETTSPSFGLVATVSHFLHFSQSKFISFVLTLTRYLQCPNHPVYYEQEIYSLSVLMVPLKEFVPATQYRCLLKPNSVFSKNYFPKMGRLFVNLTLPSLTVEPSFDEFILYQLTLTLSCIATILAYRSGHFIDLNFFADLIQFNFLWLKKPQAMDRYRLCWYASLNQCVEDKIGDASIRTCSVTTSFVFVDYNFVLLMC